MPPPQTKVLNIPVAAGVNLPNPSTARLNMLPHMIDVQKPTSTMNMALMGICTNPNDRPPSDVNAGNVTSMLVGEKIAARINNNPTNEVVESMALLEILLPREAPINLPANMKSQ